MTTGPRGATFDPAGPVYEPELIERILAHRRERAPPPAQNRAFKIPNRNISEVLGINTRLQWIPKAGQEGFIVLNYNLEDQDKDNTFHAATADLSIKFKYTFRY